MIIRRMTIVLPPRLRGSAAQVARAIAEEAAVSLSGPGASPGEHLSVAIEGRGRPGPLLARDAGMAVLKAGARR